MLPFLKNRSEASVSAPVDTKTRKPDSEDSDAYDPMHSAADDLIKAVHAKDTKAVAEALRAAHYLNQTDEQPTEGYE